MQNMNQKPLKSLRNKYSTITKFTEAFQIQDSELQGPTEYCELQMIDQEVPNIFASFPNLNFNFNSTSMFIKTPMTNSKQNDTQINSKSIKSEQIRILCEIDIVMLRHYYLLRKEVFKKHNQLFPRKQEKTFDTIAQIKKRFQHHYQNRIAMMLCRLVDEVRNNLDQEFVVCVVDDIQLIPAELIGLDAKLKQQTIESFDTCDPIQVYQEITKLIEIYLKPKQEN
ncbi:unnamed protein product (macronuclear) [Paramecium tetraurelia]|uniref:Uncharacterized protein n=1 Tax=Paramecium tetraurelia TaxID=5888 RepID=A0C1H3_PARTE|nr:uncharacterized protein GSPATT00034116001 [Paramecium tetraurelia]CAK64640.1 unnamed protein product [Paramecium tetraurelia]|eukprot:XP_001432037.1 hypothetical protein (macronuclear) [Paramecium tetraurelia strain d4-2]